MRPPGRHRTLAALALLLAGSGGAAAAAVPAATSQPAPPTVAGGATSPASTAPAAGRTDRKSGNPSAAPTPAGRGTWPLDPPAVAATFDPPEQRWGRGHRGVDLTGRLWQPVHAALGGVVRHAGPIAGRGVVVVDHGATRTTYEPVVAAVEVGDRVAAGDVVGRLQLAGSHCLPAACLHWGWRRGEEYLDPLALVGGTRVRLKPVGGPAGTPAAAGRW